MRLGCLFSSKLSFSDFFIGANATRFVTVERHYQVRLSVFHAVPLLLFYVDRLTFGSVKGRATRLVFG
jgi:hypothetical protein